MTTQLLKNKEKLILGERSKPLGHVNTGGKIPSSLSCMLPDFFDLEKLNNQENSHSKRWMIKTLI